MTTINNIPFVIFFTILTVSCSNDEHPPEIVENIKAIGSFVSVAPNRQTTEFIFPSSHTFQKIIETGDPLTAGGTLPPRTDFTGYVPINGSSTNGYLSINSETTPGGVSVLDIHLKEDTQLWEITSSQAIDFSNVGGTKNNCSGAVTPWNTIITCEERIQKIDDNMDGYNDFGWAVEVDPAAKTVLGKRWALGNFAHENLTVHSNFRTIYEGADSNPGYLYKFVADNEKDLSSGNLFVYVGSKEGKGVWVQLANSSIEERNTTLDQSAKVKATVFNGIEDVEIGPDGMVYLAVKGEGKVYRFQDSDPINGSNLTMETFVGGKAYNIVHNKGNTSISWGIGNDNLAFDGDGNLWVLQDGDNNYIWVVAKGHTQKRPKVQLFGIAPFGSEPTGITFTPDYKYLFISIQDPDSGNKNSLQIDAAGNPIAFDNHITLVMSLKEKLGKF